MIVKPSINTWILRLCKHPFLMFATIGLLTVIALIFAAKVKQEQSLKVWFPENDPAILSYEQFSNTFSADEIIVIGVFADDIFEPTIWDAIDEITQASKNIPFVHTVSSITSLANYYPPLEEGDPSVREQVLANSLLPGTFVSHDGKTGAIIIQILREGNTFDNKRLIVESVYELLASKQSWAVLDIRVAGSPVTDYASMKQNQADMSTVIPFMIFMIFVISWFTLKRAALAAIPLLIVTVAVIWTFGIMGLLGLQLTMVSTALLPIIVAIGVADSIHVISQYNHQLKTETDNDLAVVNSVIRVLKPCFFTSATTVAGLLALIVSDIVPIREFGYTAAIGVSMAFIVSTVLVPVILYYMSPRPAASYISSITPYCEWFFSSNSKSNSKPRIIMIICALVLIFSSILALRVEVGVNPLSWFDKEDPVYIDTTKIDAALGGSLSVEFLVTSKKGELKNLSTLEKLQEFQLWLEQETVITRVISIVDILKEIGRNDELRPQFPTQTGINLLLDNTDVQANIKQWVTSDASQARISGRVSLTHAKLALDQLPYVKEQIKQRFPDETLKVEITGHTNLMAAMEEHILSSQIKSLSLALIIITILIGLLLKSWIFAIIAMIPNLVPVAIGLGAMTALDIGLNPATAMVGTIMLGIVVDDTVHFLVAFRRCMQQSIGVSQSIRDSIDEAGTPIVVTSLILIFSFSALCFGEFGPSRDIGMLTAIVVSMALISNLVLLPAVLMSIPKGVWEHVFKSKALNSR
ncbi:MMPL family transporter [Paraglaciecola sp. 25GB23A]|uniref:efflux RND transporter permease subunit n=1 Tax=Paraglaciecola sp. 25GB23A TaxID=3156068 RepID=UPI0032AFCED3